jgi:hypothetical protein
LHILILSEYIKIFTSFLLVLPRPVPAGCD